MTCPRCGLTVDAAHPSAVECAVALRQRLQAMFGELEVARKTGSYDPGRLETFERESKKLLARVEELEKEPRS